MTINKVGSKGIEDGAVAAADFGPGVVTDAKIATGTITNSKLANSSITVSGTSINLGASATFNNQFIDWQAVVTSDGSTVTTMAAGKGYFIDNSSASGLVKLPTSASRGDTILIKDYAGNFGTNTLNINRNSHKIQGVANDGLLKTDRAAVALVYVDATKGWLYADEHNVADLQNFISATGGTVTTSGDHKIHAFTGDGNFVVTSAGSETGGTAVVDYLVVAGGAGGGHDGGGGGGAGGFRLGSDVSCKPALAAAALPVTSQTYPITVGGGGAGGTGPTDKGASGSNSVFSTITSAGGGGGGSNSTGPANVGVAGGSGGGSTCTRCSPNTRCGASGNTPPVSPPQGNDGGDSVHNHPGSVQGGGGGGAGAAGENGQSSPFIDGSGGNGSPVVAIFGASPQPFYSNCGVYAGGGGGGSNSSPSGGTAGSGGGGAGATNGGAAGAGTANSGGGGGGGPGSNGPTSPARKGAAGGKGVVIIRYKFQ